MSNTNNEICRLENVTKIYKMGENVCPLNNASLVVNSGDFISIEGPSGTGKSTMLYLMGGILKADSGKILILGQDICTMKDQDLTVLRRENLGFMFQETHLFQALTVEENLRFAARFGKRKVGDGEVEAILLELGLAERSEYLPHQLSVGQRRRLVAARALLGNPKLILSDEPTNDLDEHWAEVVVSLLAKAAAEGAGVVMVTHNPLWSARANIHYRLVDGGLI